MAALNFLNDTFTGADNTDLLNHASETGGTWVFHTSAPGSIYIVGNRATFAGPGVYHTPANFTGDMVISANYYFNGATGGTNAYAAVAFLMDTNLTVPSYLFLVYQNGQWQVSKYLNGTYMGNVAAYITATPGSGTTTAVTITRVGTTISVAIAGTTRMVFTEADLLSGRVGIVGGGAGSVGDGQQVSDITAITPTLQSSVRDTLANKTTLAVTLTGNNTTWTPGTPGTPTFTIAGGTGASIVSQVVTSATSASLVVNTGTANGTLTITDPSTAATAAITVTTNNIVFIGDSITGGTGASSPSTTGMVAIAKGALGAGWKCIDVCQPGRLLSYAATLTSVYAAQYDATKAVNVAVIFAGTNDSYSAISGATTNSVLVSLCRTLRGMGYRIIVLDPLVRGGSAPSEAEAVIYANLIKTQWRNYAQAFADVRSDSFLSVLANLPDTIHPDDTGHARIGLYVASQVQSVSSGGSLVRGRIIGN